MNVPKPLLKFLVHVNGYGPSKKLDRSIRDSQATQQWVLRSILDRSQNTEIGRRYGFKSIWSIEEFQKQVPIQDFESLSTDIDRIRNGESGILYPAKDSLHMFGLTSGSTGHPKTIPVTRKYVERFRQTYGIWSTRILKDHPKLAEGKYLAMYSDWRESFTENGIPCGAVTGLLASLQPPWIRKRMVVSAFASSIKDPNVKEFTVLHHALNHETALWTSANPSSLLRLANRLEEHLESLIRGLADGSFVHLDDLPEEYRRHRDFLPNPARARTLEKRIESKGDTLPKTLWPALEILSCWMGGTLSPYLDALKQKFPGIPMRDPGLMASEGRFTIPIHDNTSSGVPDLSSLFFEFFPADGDAPVPVGQTGPLQLSHEIEVGKKYFLIFTCDWGLYRYHIDDIVEVTDRIGDVPLIRFVRKGSGISSITGEKLSEDQVVGAIHSLPGEFRSKRNDLVLSPVWGDPPNYILFVEDGDDLTEEECIDAADMLEERLLELNCEYQSKRESHRIGPIQVALIDPGSFDLLKKREVESAGGRAEQYKLKRIRGDLQFAESLSPYRVLSRDDTQARFP